VGRQARVHRIFIVTHTYLYTEIPLIYLYCILSALVAFITFSLIKQPSISPTRASSLVSLFFIIILYLVSQFIYLEYAVYMSVIFGASFVGMCSHKIISDRAVIISGLVFGLLFAYLYPRYSTVGGALGFSAFLSVAALKLLGELNKILQRKDL